ncbi:hypothetical protein OHU11_12155 [Streptomyces sp. NBC_00257]|uniref:hypothetical protein n=1 Tax=unclassified Streptomyces TaxID=2593676 RepID=UPI0022512ACF|nr:MULTISPECIES: hypothetical protein [unclassified Streptomyces]MCX5428429.1 hypothetical protein [Streptomyces sp. NBC_00062]
MTAVAVRSEIDEEEARWIVTCFDALQVFDREGAQLRLEPLLRECVVPPVTHGGSGTARRRPGAEGWAPLPGSACRPMKHLSAAPTGKRADL